MWSMISVTYLAKCIIPFFENYDFVRTQSKIARAFSKKMWKVLGFIEIFRFHMYGKTPYADRLRTCSVIGIMLD